MPRRSIDGGALSLQVARARLNADHDYQQDDGHCEQHPQVQRSALRITLRTEPNRERLDEPLGGDEVRSLHQLQALEVG
jgi:hypothetical protein